MIIYKKRCCGMEIDYLQFSIFRYTIWVTKSKFIHKYPRIVIWKMSKENNVGIENAWTFNPLNR